MKGKVILELWDLDGIPFRRVEWQEFVPEFHVAVLPRAVSLYDVESLPPLSPLMRRVFRFSRIAEPNVGIYLEVP